MPSPGQRPRGIFVPALLLVLLLGAVCFWIWRFREIRASRGSSDARPSALELLNEYERREAETNWGPELVAEEHGAVFERIWDSLNGSSNKLETLASWASFDVSLFTFEKDDPGAFQAVRHGISILKESSQKRVLHSNEFRAFVREASGRGWELVRCEFRHNAFRPASDGRNAMSTYMVEADLINTNTEERVMLEGDVFVSWVRNGSTPRVATVDASQLAMRIRKGPPPFRQVLDEEITPPEGSYFIDPLIVYDLDGDGQLEIILAAKNLVFARTSAGTYEKRPLCAVSPGILFTAVLGDFTGDGIVDFLAASFDGLLLYEGAPGGEFRGAPRQAWKVQRHLKFVQALTFGDVDNDGDLDVFVGQYKPPFSDGQMPFPYFDANDGNPSFLLLNDGSGSFTDVTRKAGLGAKCARRVYSASLADLDDDGDIDLLVVSDFAGLDAYENDGSGNFRDVTDRWFGGSEIAESAGFGMGHTVADIDHDNRLDLLMLGMNSPTADRLSALGLTRKYDRPDAGMRERMSAGNRLYFGGEDGFREGRTSAAIARTGWSWGAIAEDFDNDGYPEVYVTNGHETGKSVRDYEREFWLHDIYVGNSQENSLAVAYFKEKYARTRGAGESYGGYERNRFYLNLHGTNFVDCSFLLGVDSQADSRNVLGEDLNGDGKVDLLFTTFERYPRERQTLKVFENRLSVAKQCVTLVTPDWKRVGRQIHLPDGSARILSSTESYRSQHGLRVRVPAESEIIERLKAEGFREVGRGSAAGSAVARKKN